MNIIEFIKKMLEKFFKIQTNVKKEIIKEVEQKDMQSEEQEIILNLLKTNKINDLIEFLEKNKPNSESLFKILDWIDENDSDDEDEMKINLVSKLKKYNNLLNIINVNDLLFSQDLIIKTNSRFKTVELSSEAIINITRADVLIKYFANEVLTAPSKILELINTTNEWINKFNELIQNGNLQIDSQNFLTTGLINLQNRNELLNKLFNENKNSLNNLSESSEKDILKEFKISVLLPKEMMENLIEIKSIYNKLLLLQQNDEQNFAAKKMYNEKIGLIVNKYLEIDLNLRDSKKDNNGNTAKDLTINALNEIKDFFVKMVSDIENVNFDSSIQEIKIQDRYIKNVKSFM